MHKSSSCNRINYVADNYNIKFFYVIDQLNKLIEIENCESYSFLSKFQHYDTSDYYGINRAIERKKFEMIKYFIYNKEYKIDALEKNSNKRTLRFVMYCMMTCGSFDDALKVSSKFNIKCEFLNKILKQRSEFAPNIKKYNCDIKFRFHSGCHLP